VTTSIEDREHLAASPAHDLALACLEAGIDAAHPRRAIERHCSIEGDTLRIGDSTHDLSGFDSIRILGGGKAADEIAAALESILGDRLDGGVVVTDEATAAPDRVEVRIGEHPAPGSGSASGARAVLEHARALDESALVIAAITGGGSALLCAPARGLSVANLQAVTDGLLESGASIDELNTVRRACSKIKGGGLAAAAAPATVVGVLVSDVVGDDPAIIASGPTVPTETAPGGALDVLDRHGLEVPAVRSSLETATPRDPRASVENHVVASSRDAIEAARAVAMERGHEPCVLSTRIEGEATEAGRFHAAIAAEAREHGDPVDPPAVVLSGGETTVHVTGGGTGGPNAEFALAAAMELPPDVVLGAVDTDGRDGSTDAAGALVDAATVTDHAAARAALTDNDSHSFLDERDAVIRTGATGTNVNDLRVIVVPSADASSEPLD
jgi:hydroxypyruvate reductase